MQLNPPPKVRSAIYVLIVLGSAVMIPLHAGGVVSDLVFNVWTSVSAAGSLLAALNVNM